MDHFVTGTAIKRLREQKGYTQRQLAELVMVSDKAVSKWETGHGLPDIMLVEPLAQALGVSITELLSGEYAINRNRAANLLRSCFYVCPICGNVIRSIGEGSFSCCGVTLPPLEAEPAEGEHRLQVERVETDHYVTLTHPMERAHYISFIAYVMPDRVFFRKLYPEQDAEARFPVEGHGLMLAYCNRHGLFCMRI